MSNTAQRHIRFDPGTPLPVNWIISFGFWLAILSFGFWLAILFLGAMAEAAKWAIRHDDPPESIASALLLYTPLVTDLILLAGMWVYATKARSAPFASSICWSRAEGAGEARETTLRHSLRVGATFAASVVVGYGVYLLLLRLVASFPGPQTRSAEVAPAVAYARSATAVMFAPLVEELFYRGILFMHAHGAARKVGATAISTLAFTVAHLPQYSGPRDEIHWAAIGTMFALGLSCSVARSYFDRVWPAYVLHLSYNCSVALALPSLI
jgi:membrane protease YdiL (CAAX protease family)